MPSTSVLPIAETSTPRSSGQRRGHLSLLGRLQAALIIATFAGYPVAALAPALLGWESRLPALMLRLLVVLASVLVLLIAAQERRRRQRETLPLVIFVGCWTVLLARFVTDVVIEGVQPGVYLVDGSDFLLFVVGVSLLPASALFVGISSNALRSAHAWLCLILAFLVAAYAWQFRTLADEGTIYRAQADALNAITYASLGALLILTVLTFRFDARKRWTPRLYRSAAVVLGGWALVTAASRGPILSLALAGIPALWLSVRHGQRNRWRHALLLACVVGSVSVLLSALEDVVDNSFLASRVAGFEDDVSTLERIYLIQASWSIFTDNPLTGGAIAEPLTHSYPHNIILEALMVGGVGLGLLVVGLLVYCLVSARRYLSLDDDRRFLGTLIIYYCAMSMLSGSLYTGPELWAAFALSASCRNVA